MKTRILLLSILVFALLIRVYKLSSIPSSLYWEEAAIAYDAYSVAQTGKDYHGNAFPILAFPSFGDYKPSVYFYAVVPFIKMFGLSEVAVRLPSALAGVGTVWIVYLIGTLLYKKNIGLLAACVYAVQPWSVQISHAGFETNLATFFIVAGVYFLLKAGKERKTFFLLPAAILLSISMYTYQAARVTAPLLGFVFGLKSVRFKHFKWCILAGGVALLMSLPILVNIKNPVITQRAAETSIFSDINVITESNVLREADGNSMVSRVLHHRYLLFGERVLHQYFQNFSVRFLFLDGDENLRHGTGEFGVLYHWEFFAILVGVYVLIQKRSFEGLAPVWWILLAGIPVAITTVSPHTLRFLSASPAFALLSAVGMHAIISTVKSRWRVWVAVCFGALFVVELFVYLHYFYLHYADISAGEWQYGYKELFQTLESMRKPGQPVYVTREHGRPSIYYMFYTKQDPRYVQSQNAVVKKDQQELLALGEYQFVDALPLERKVLVASTPEKMPAGAEIQHEIRLPTGEVTWVIWEQK